MSQTSAITDDGTTGDITGLVRRYDKHQQASIAVAAMGWIKATYDDAIEYTGLPKGMRGALFMWGTFCFSICFFIIWTIRGSVFDNDWLIVCMAVPFIAALSTVAIYIALLAVRLELFGYDDAPTLFDRKNRKVYRVTRVRPGGVIGLFKPWPLEASAYDWDLLDCEHHAYVTTTGTTATREHKLMFMVRQSADDPTVVDTFQIGSGLALSDRLCDMTWEHIRRFMEEHGPHLPPGEALADRTRPDGLWQSMGAVGPFGPKYMEWWRTSFMITLANHICFPVFLPMNLLWGLGNWLSYRTARPVKWSAQVQLAVGPRRSGAD